MIVTFEPVLALLSVIVAVLGAMSALALTVRLEERGVRPWQRKLALANGGLSLGATLWSTHVIAAAAVKSPALATRGAVGIDTATAVAMAVVAAWIGFYVAGVRRFKAIGILAGGIVLGLGVSRLLHPAVWDMAGCATQCDPALVAAAAVVAMWLAFAGRAAWRMLAAGLILGGAIVCVAYAAMVRADAIPIGGMAERSAALLSEHPVAIVIAVCIALLSASNFVFRGMVAKDRMTIEQIELVQQTYRGVERAGGEVANLFYQRLFEIAPELRDLFPADLSDQKDKLLAVLASAILNLHKIESVTPVIRDLGRRHVYYGVEPAHYRPVGEALVWAIERVLGAGFTPAAKEAWIAAYTTLTKVMTDAAAEVAPHGRRLAA
jgi:hemoglobin-like flavoprotein/NO-binding membrane sensor protein with MHYT domain